MPSMMRSKKLMLAIVLLFAFGGSAFAAHASYSPASGDLVKGLAPAVYYVTGDGKRLAFPNEAAYFSWYADFAHVQTISDGDLAALPLAGLVTLRPGRAVRFQSSSKVYAVAHGGTLRWLASEDIAKLIFGVNWSSKVIIIPDAFFTSYKFGVDVSSAGQYWWAKESSASTTLVDDLDPNMSPDAVASPAAPAPSADNTAPPVTVTTPPMPTVAAKNVLFVLWDPKRPDSASFDKSILQREVYGVAPSVADYYAAQSNGKTEIVNAGILGWYNADYPPEHYWTDDTVIHESDGYLTGAAERVGEAMTKAAADFDFKKYDANGDGTLTTDELAIFVVIPSSSDPTEDTAVLSAPGKTTTPFVADGVTINAVGELYIGAPLGSTSEFGTIAYSFAKSIFNLSDTSYGDFSLMSNHYSDLNLDPAQRLSLKWLAPTIIPKAQEVTSVELPADGSAIRVDRDQPGGPGVGTEYFLIENREHGIYDNSLPDTGIAIWDVNSGSATLVRLNSGGATLDDTQALWHQGTNATTNLAQELHWTDGARSGIRLLNLGPPAAVMGFTLEKKIITDLDLTPVPSPIQ